MVQTSTTAEDENVTYADEEADTLYEEAGTDNSAVGSRSPT